MSQTEESPRKVGFFGGSFDPPHLGHLGVARAARAALGLERVLFAPVGAQPLKPDGAAAPFADRVVMTRLAIEGEAGFEVSLADAPRAGQRPNYTVDTLERLAAELGSECRLFCLMGADSFLLLRHWRRAAELPFRAGLVVASRPGERLEVATALPPGVRVEPGSEWSGVVNEVAVEGMQLANAAGERAAMWLLPGVEIDVSATEVRRRVSTGQGAEALVPAAVLAYIGERGLYCSAAKEAAGCANTEPADANGRGFCGNEGKDG